MVRTFIASLALVSFAVPALAKTDPAAVTFTRDGVAYVYTVTWDSENREILKGTADGVPFRLVVGERSVEGTFDRRTVSFSLNEVRARSQRDRLAAR